MQSLRSAMTFKCEKQGHMCMHPTCPTLWTTCCRYLQGCCLSKWVSLITVINSRRLSYLCTHEGVSPRIPSNPMMSLGPCGICLQGLPLVSQSVISPQFRPCPRGLHKQCDSPCSFHSDSDQQKDNIKHIQPLHSTTHFICMCL